MARALCCGKPFSGLVVASGGRKTGSALYVTSLAWDIAIAFSLLELAAFAGNSSSFPLRIWDGRALSFDGSFDDALTRGHILSQLEGR